MKTDELLFMEPIFHNKIWGGRRLEHAYGYELPDGPVGECWAISAHPHGDCRIVGGPFDGAHLSELWANHRDLFANEEGEVFPLLVKIIDALDDLSIQVHPDDDYAREHENGSLGKRECWYILDTHEGGHIVVGQKTKSPQEFMELAEKGQWGDILAEIPSKPGDFFQVDPGTVHAILGATMVLETQESSDVTYRVYDYDRVQDDGTKRDLHLKQALDVIDFSRPAPESGDVTAPEVDGITQLVETVSYTVLRLNVRPEAPITLKRDFPFLCLSVIKGSGTIRTDSEKETLALGTHLIVTAKTGSVTLEGDMTLIASYV